MGQFKLACGCALVAWAIFGTRLSAQEANPFGFEDHGEATKEAATAGAETAKDRRHTRYEAERRIEAILDKPLRTPLAFIDTPLNQIMELIEEEYELPIEFDVAALDAVAISPEAEVNATHDNLSLRSALELMLRQIDDLTYVVDNEVLLITTQEEAAHRVETRVYRVDDLVVANPSQSVLGANADYDSLVALIIANVEHDSWRASGTGQAEIRSFHPGMLVITHIRETHREIDVLLTELRRNKAEVLADAAELESAGEAVTRSFRFNDFSTAESAPLRETIEQAIRQSVDWDADGESTPDSAFLHVLPRQVIVRHRPEVVAEVERTVREILGQQPSPGGFGRGNRGGF